jgi:hypothetical protein
MKRSAILFSFILMSAVFTDFRLEGNFIHLPLPVQADSLPTVLTENHNDIVESRLRLEGMLRFAEHRLPDNPEDWAVYKKDLRKKIIEKAVVHIDHDLPLNIREYGSIKMKGYIIKNIAFQTMPGVYATANLFIPDDKAPFPAVINLHAHSGRFDDNDQAVGHSLAANGYVCLSIDPWGAGERTSVHGVTEYHGSNLGASFMNAGESLMGIQITDNMRGVDLLCSLPYVDGNNIGAAGASGGGNQTMWLAAVDERIKAAVPVVSVGTFESYVMRSNCICELLVDGLTFTEEAGVLALARAVMPCNHNKDANPTFFSSEMLRSYRNALPVFRMTGAEKNIAYRTYDLPHGFLTEDREAMLGWFDLHLKNQGTGADRKEVPFKLLTEAELMVYPKGKRDPDITTTEQFLVKKGNDLRSAYLSRNDFDPETVRKELKEILRLKGSSGIRNIFNYGTAGGWERIALETSDGKLIPILLKDASAGQPYVIIVDPQGKNNIPSSLITEYLGKGTGVVLADLTGSGETLSRTDYSKNRSFVLHTLSRAELWLGRTVLGDWVGDIEVVSGYLRSEKGAKKITLDGTKEAGLAGLFFCSLGGGPEEIVLRQAPVSYLFDTRDSVDYFSMGIHLPGFLKWGDISLAAALTGKNIKFIDPVTMSGRPVRKERLEAFRAEFETVRKRCRLPGEIVFVVTSPGSH